MLRYNTDIGKYRFMSWKMGTKQVGKPPLKKLLFACEVSETLKMT
jgi:hypothetical protein